MALTLAQIQIGWISALPIEALLAEIMLDEQIEQTIPLPPNDNNIYTYGRIKINGSDASHIVAIAQLPLSTPGKSSTATVANNMRRTFPNLKFGMMVGIAGGVWTPEEDVRLGDVVVGVPDDGGPGVIQYDYGKAIQEQEFILKGSLNKAPDVLRTAAGLLRRKHMRKPGEYVSTLNSEEVKYHAPRPSVDTLFSPGYLHQGGHTCGGCDAAHAQDRLDRTSLVPRVHYGAIASGDSVIKDAVLAEKIQKSYSIMCFEMEAAGLGAFPCLVIRGISDYADTHKNDDWHAYAAATAAAYAKELLAVVPLTAVAELPSTGNTHWNVPRAPNPLFTGRQTLLDDMKKYLVVEPTKNNRPVFVLQGIGGAGKSEAAIKFATENQDNFWGIFWIDADNRRGIEQGFAEIAKMQTPPLADSTSNDVIRWLATIKESWLLILDNCDDGMIDFARYIPSRGGSVVLTTRLIECKDLGTWANLDDLGNDNAIKLLLRACGFKFDEQQAHMSAAEAVVSLLGQHALALVHAGAYIKKGYCTLNEYVQFYKDEQNRLMEFSPVQQASRYGSVYTTFEISAKALAFSDKHESHLALKLLDILAFLSRETIEEDIFDRAFDECQNLEKDRGLTWEEDECQRVERCAVSSTDNDLTTKHSHDPGIVNSSTCKIYVVCDLNGRYRQVITDEAQKQQSNEVCFADHIVPQECESSRQPTCSQPEDAVSNSASSDRSSFLEVSYSQTMMTTHDSRANNTVDNTTHEFPAHDSIGDDGDITHLGIWHCRRVRSSGLVGHQKKKLRAARVNLADLSLIKVDGSMISMHPLVHEWARTRLGKLARQYAWEQTLSVLALSSVNDIQWHTFTPQLLPHADACFRSLSEDNPQFRLSLNVVRALYRLAWHFYHDAKVEPSLAIFETLSASYAVQPQSSSFRSEKLLRAKAMCFSELGKSEEMQSCVDQVVQSTTRWFQCNSWEVFDSQLLLADFHHTTGNFQAAATLLESSYERYSNADFLNHLDKDNLLHVLVTVHESLENYERAVTLLEQKLKIAEQVYPPDDSIHFTGLNRLAKLYMHLGRADHAVSLLEKVVHPDSEPMPSDCWPLIIDTLAQAYMQLEKHDRAIKFLEEVYLYDSRTLLADDASRTATMDRLATAYTEVGMLDKAAKLLREVIEIDGIRFEAADPERLTSMERLAQVYLDLEQPYHAAELLEEVIEIEASCFPTDLSQRWPSMERLADTYLDLDLLEKGAELLEKVIEIQTLCLPTHDPDRTTSMHKLANAYLRLDKPSQAATLLEEVVALDSSVMPEGDPCRLIAVRSLALTYTYLDDEHKNEQAIALLEEVIDKGCQIFHTDAESLRLTEAVLAEARDSLHRTRKKQQPPEDHEQAQCVLAIPVTESQDSVNWSLGDLTKGAARMF